MGCGELMFQLQYFKQMSTYLHNLVVLHKQHHHTHAVRPKASIAQIEAHSTDMACLAGTGQNSAAIDYVQVA